MCIRDSLRAAPLAGLLCVLDSRLWRRRPSWLRTVLAVAVGSSLAVNFNLSWREGFRRCLEILFFPQDMVLYVGGAAVVACCFAARNLWKGNECDLKVPLVLSFSSLLA